MFVLITVMCVQLGDAETCRAEMPPMFFHSEQESRHMAGVATVSTLKHVQQATTLKPTRVGSFCERLEAQTG
jgi:hypothetical protein